MIKTRVAQLRMVFETLRYPTHSEAEKRQRVNEFLEAHKSSAPLDVCFQDIKTERVQRVDTMDDLILTLSFETQCRVAIVLLEDAGEWVRTYGLIKEEESPEYVLIDLHEGAKHVCKNLDFEVEKKLLETPAEFGYVLVFFRKEKEEEKKEESQLIVEKKEEKKEEVEKTGLVKKKHKPITTTNKKKRGGAASNPIEMTSEESTNK
jgi:hypothetical protein